MVNNYDRIYAEITKGSEVLASDSNLEPRLWRDLIMEIVDLEDQHRTKHVSRINQQIQEKILLFAQSKLRMEEE